MPPFSGTDLPTPVGKPQSVRWYSLPVLPPRRFLVAQRFRLANRKRSCVSLLQHSPSSGGRKPPVRALLLKSESVAQIAQILARKVLPVRTYLLVLFPV